MCVCVCLGRDVCEGWVHVYSVYIKRGGSDIELII